MMTVVLTLLPTRRETKKVTLKNGATVENAIRKAGLLPGEWIPIRGDEPLPLDEKLRDGDALKLVSVVSGG